MSRRWWTAIGGTAVASVAAEIGLHDTSHAVFPWHSVPGFDLLWGAAGCLAIIVVSKAIGKAWLQRPDDYWDRTP
ncbi:MAG: hypothetical protein FJW23_13270 [Acidimicrobiia bacterium]|nr:hypothetical protein [Acidimicrobiia bacterium]